MASRQTHNGKIMRMTRNCCEIVAKPRWRCSEADLVGDERR